MQYVGVFLVCNVITWAKSQAGSPFGIPYADIERCMVDGDVGHERKSEYEQDVAPAERDNNRERDECADDEIELVRGDPPRTGYDADREEVIRVAGP